MNKRMSLYRAKSLFHYDREAGRLVWANAKPGVTLGQKAGCPVNGIWYVTVERERFQVKQIVWLICTGMWPTGTLYHRDKDRANCAIENLTRVRGGVPPTVRNFSVVQGDGGLWEVKSNGRLVKELEADKTNELMELLNVMVRY